ncbi:hypothetical protein GCM10010372_65240 [Streptomyces tauricus]|nr:hypothetical protein GCM10010372_65240 [Streptomyces tauricus]
MSIFFSPMWSAEHREELLAQGVWLATSGINQCQGPGQAYEEPMRKMCISHMGPVRDALVSTCDARKDGGNAQGPGRGRARRPKSTANKEHTCHGSRLCSTATRRSRGAPTIS